MDRNRPYEPSTRQWVRDQVELYEETGGREGGDVRGMPVVILTTVGLKSGNLRKTPLMRVEHDGAYAAIASYGGRAQHPAWYYNVLADPHVLLQDGPVARDMLAREASGEERRAWWARAVAAYGNYEEYQANTDREIPLLVLEPNVDHER